MWLGHTLHGDLGQSWVSNRPVLAELIDRAPASFELVFLGVLIGTAVGVPVGLVAALRRGRAFDHATRLLSLLGYSVPTYFLGLAMLLVFFYLLDWAPPGMGRISLMLNPPPRITGSFLLDALLSGDLEAARSAAAQLVLPVACIAMLCAAPIIAQTRGIVLNVLAAPPIAFAEAQGLPPSRIARIALRNAATPVITFIGAELVGLIGSGSLIEYVFAWGGTGQFGPGRHRERRLRRGPGLRTDARRVLGHRVPGGGPARPGAGNRARGPTDVRCDPSLQLPLAPS